MTDDLVREKPGPAPGEHLPNYAAFIAYARESSARSARRVDRALTTIARRHEGGGDLRVFRDATSLRAGPLRSDLSEKLQRSRALVVLLDSHTVDSTWVDDEVTTWLTTVGSPERLYLVRTDPELNLAWDGRSEGFECPDRLPASLRAVFTTEQHWIDLASSRRSDAEDALARLCASLLGSDPQKFHLEEARYQRRRRRRLVGVLGVVSLLLIAAIAAGVAALNSRDQAQQSRDAAIRSGRRALAQADAAEAVLAATDSPTLAIERAVSAAQRDHGPTVRSALLAASTAARRLVRTLRYPEGTTRHPPAGATFSSDGTRLAAWGPAAADGRTYLRIWNLASGNVLTTGPVDAADLDSVTLLANDRAVACSRSGPVELSFSKQRVRGAPLSQDQGSAESGRCVVREFAGGAVVSSASANAPNIQPGIESKGSRVYVVDRRGRVSIVEGIVDEVSNRGAPSAALVGPAGIFVASSSGVRRVSTLPAEAALFADRQGRFLIKIRDAEWGVVSPSAQGPVLRQIAVPNNAVGVVPLISGGEIQQDLAWILPDGTVGWTRNDRKIRVLPRPGMYGTINDLTQLAPLGDESFVALHGLAVAILRPPTGTTTATVNGVGSEWTISPVDAWASGPITSRCPDGGSALIKPTPSSKGALLVDDSGPVATIDGEGRYMFECSVVDIGRSLFAFTGIGGTTRVEVRSNLVAQDVAISQAAPYVALLHTGLPIEILSIKPPDELPRPWDLMPPDLDRIVAGFGERELGVETDGAGASLLMVGRGGRVRRRILPSLGHIIAARPDGKGALVQESASPGQARRWFRGQDDGDASAVCREGTTVRYVPRAGFARSLAAAEAQVPVVQLGRRKLDCRSGRASDVADPRDILQYDIGSHRGRIVSRKADGGIEVTTWTRGLPHSLHSFPGPYVSSSATDVRFDARSDIALTHDPTNPELAVFRRGGGRWRRTLTIASGLGDVVDAAVVGDGSLILAISRAGDFELYDSAAGHKLASDYQAGAETTLVTGMSVEETGDDLRISFTRSGDASAAPSGIDIPIGVHALVQQLCQIHPVVGCGTRS